MHLIGINGFKRSGKGETAKIIERLYAGNVQGVGFADKLKILGARALGYTDRTDEQCIALMDQWKDTGWLEGGEIGGLSPEVAITGRQYLQNLGNEARVVFGDSFWIDMVLPTPVPTVDGWVEAASSEALALRYPDVDVLCITDLRYPNEAERVLALGGKVWEIVRPGQESDGHASEIPLPRELVSLTLNNDGTLEDLETKVEIAMVALG